LLVGLSGRGDKGWLSAFGLASRREKEWLSLFQKSGTRFDLKIVSDSSEFSGRWRSVSGEQDDVLSCNGNMVWS
jgi:hypothetical protein